VPGNGVSCCVENFAPTERFFAPVGIFERAENRPLYGSPAKPVVQNILKRLDYEH
jgi:hypothetical protein